MRLRTVGTLSVRIAAIAAALAVSSVVVGVRFGDGPSLPPALFVPACEDLERGRYATFCLSEAKARTFHERGYLSDGQCPGGVSSLTKQILGVPGDQVEVRSDGVWINGDRVANSSPKRVDSAGRSLSIAQSESSATGYWLFSTHTSASLDSRYFGPISGAALQCKVPLWFEGAP